ncbi:hypothetical protein ACRRTK_012721 [Alexandromys fortis]
MAKDHLELEAVLKLLEHAVVENLPKVHVELSRVLANPGNSQAARFGTGLPIKNSLTWTDPDIEE